MCKIGANIDLSIRKIQYGYFHFTLIYTYSHLFSKASFAIHSYTSPCSQSVYVCVRTYNVFVLTIMSFFLPLFLFYLYFSATLIVHISSQLNPTQYIHNIKCIKCTTKQRHIRFHGS